MQPQALGIVLFGSLCHLGWNVLAKRATDPTAFLWLVLALPAGVGLPFVVAAGVDGSFDVAALACVVASGVLNAGYVRLLARSYGIADLSFVYPGSRGLGVVLAMLGGVVLMGHRPSVLGAAGLGLAVAAVLAETWAAQRSGRVPAAALRFTALTGMLVAAYMLVDSLGVSHVSPWLYLPAVHLPAVVLLARSLLRDGRAAREWRRGASRVVVGATLVVLAYGSVLVAMTMAPVAYVAAARASAILASGLAGHVILGEHVPSARWAAIALLSVGLVFMALA